MSRIALLALLALAVASPSSAHHSFAMFDRDQVRSVSGVVKEFEWTNPHMWLHLVAADGLGRPREWNFEMPSIQQGAAAGWNKDSVRPGDRIAVEFHPLKDGSRGGQLIAATLADGSHLGLPVIAR